MHEKNVSVYRSRGQKKIRNLHICPVRFSHITGETPKTKNLHILLLLKQIFLMHNVQHNLIWSIVERKNEWFTDNKNCSLLWAHVFRLFIRRCLRIKFKGFSLCVLTEQRYAAIKRGNMTNSLFCKYFMLLYQFDFNDEACWDMFFYLTVSQVDLNRTIINN